VLINDVGHAENWDEIPVEGDIPERDAFHGSKAKDGLSRYP
jgi:hypothetical protein